MMLLTSFTWPYVASFAIAAFMLIAIFAIGVWAILNEK